MLSRKGYKKSTMIKRFISIMISVIMLAQLSIQTAIYAESLTDNTMESLIIQNGLIYGTASDDALYSVRGSGDGGFIAVGYTQGAGEVFGTSYSRGGKDAIILKIDRKMKVVAKATFGGAGDECFNSVTPLVDGSFIAVGYAAKESFGTGDLKAVTSNGGQDAIIVRFDKDLSLTDVAAFGGKGDDDQFISVLSRDNGTLLAAGTKGMVDGTKSDIKVGVLVQYSNKLKQLNSLSIGGKGSVVVNSLINGENGDVYAVGMADEEAFSGGKYLTGLAAKGKNDAIIVKYNPEAKSITAFNAGGAGNDTFRGVARLKNGEFIAVGTSEFESFGTADWNYEANVGFGETDGVVVKFDSGLNIVDNMNFGGKGVDKYSGVYALDDGGFVVTGFSENASFAENDASGSWKGIEGLGGEDFVVNTYDRTLKAVSLNRYGSEMDDEATAVEYYQDGGVVVAGFTISPDSRKNCAIYHLKPQKSELRPAFVDKLTFCDVEGLDYDLVKKLSEYADDIDSITKTMENGVSISQKLSGLEKKYAEIIPLISKRNRFEVRNPKTNAAIDRIFEATNDCIERALELEDKDKIKTISLMASENVMDLLLVSDNVVKARNMAIKIEKVLMEGLCTFEIENYVLEGKHQKFEVGLNDESEVGQMLVNTSRVVNAINKSFETRNIGVNIQSKFRIKANLSKSNENVKIVLTPSIITLLIENAIDSVIFDAQSVQTEMAPEELKGTFKKAEVIFEKITGGKTLSKLLLENDWFVAYDIKTIVDSKTLVNFERNPIIRLKYLAKETEDTDFITAFRLLDNDAMQNVGGIYDKVSGSLRFDSGSLGIFVVRKNSASFRDVYNTSWAKHYIEAMAAKGIIKGMETGAFEESRFVSRAEFVTMMVNMLKVKLSNKGSRFADVSDRDWFKPFVVTASENGIVSTTAEYFNPRKPITRQEMATIIGNVFAKTQQGMVLQEKGIFLEKFMDKDSIEDFAKNHVAVMNAYSIMGGRTVDMFMPLEKVMRKEAATALYNMMTAMRK